MKETVISWTVANWITVFLMFVLGSFVLGAAAALISKMKNKEA